MRKKILMACIHYWDSPFQVGSHHLARCFLQAGFDVFYVSSPLTPLHIFKGFGQEFRERFWAYRTGGMPYLNGRLWTYVPFALIAPRNNPILRNKVIVRRWPDTTFPDLFHLVARRGFCEVDILYLDSIFQSFWLKALRFKKSVFRVMDNHLGFPGWGKSILEVAKDIAKSVDVVVYSAKTLEHYVQDLEPERAAYVPNSINFESFTSSSREIPTILRKIPKPIAVYVGAMDAWFNFSLIARAAQDLPNVSFVLIGPDKLARNKFRGVPNIHMIGPVKHSRLAQYLYNSDAGIIPFNISRYPSLIHSINPLKLYEYLACGLPVVSTEWEELRRIDSPAVLCRGANEFIRALEKAVTNPQNKEVFIQYAKKHDWGSSFQTLMRAIGEL